MKLTDKLWMARRRLLPRGPAALAVALALFATAHGRAAVLKSAEVTAVVNEVKVVDPAKGERAAELKDVVRGDLGIRTGLKSRAELLFQDKTLTRLGANTVFSFNQGTRELELERGTMLLQVPKNAGGAKVRTAAVTAAITGTTILLEYSPVKWTPRNPPGVSADVAQMAPEQSLLELQNPRRRYSAADLAELRHKAALARKAMGHVKVMVLEGTLRLFLNNRVGESVLISAGQMIILSPTALTIPPPVSFDIAQLAKTSLLVNNSFWSTGSTVNMVAVAREIGNQTQLKNRGDLVETNLIIFGGGTQVMAQVDQSTTAARSTAQNQPNSHHNASPSSDSPAGILSVVPSALPSRSSAIFPGTGGSTATTLFGGPPPPLMPGISGDAITTSMLSGAVPVLPTEGADFIVYSTAGVAENSNNRTATFDTRTFTLAPAAPGETHLLKFDYRFMTDEFNTGSSVADKAIVTIFSGTESFELTIDRDILQPTPSSLLTPVAQQGVGGFQAGTDWLSFTIDITRFLGTAMNVTFAVFDVGDTVVDTALAVDNLRTELYSGGVLATAVPGSLTLNLDSAVFGIGPGEFHVPNLEGLPARNDSGPAADSGTFIVNAAGEITLNSALNASTGLNGTDTTFGGRGGTVQFDSAGAAININAPIKVSESDTAGKRASAAGGKIALRSGKTSGVAINIANTGELLALLNSAAPGPGGRIEVTSAGGDILINGKVIADRGTVDVRNNGPAGMIHVSGAQIAGDVVKIGALGIDGQLTISAGSRINAANTLKLYGGTGAPGKVAFTGAGTVDLTGSQIHIRANTVEISGATNVNNNGATSVHAENHNYNAVPGIGGGQFRNAVTQGGVAGAPGFD